MSDKLQHFWTACRLGTSEDCDEVLSLDQLIDLIKKQYADAISIAEKSIASCFKSSISKLEIKITSDGYDDPGGPELSIYRWESDEEFKERQIFEDKQRERAATRNEREKRHKLELEELIKKDELAMLAKLKAKYEV